MTEPTTTAGGHLEDGLLVRLVDEQAGADEGAGARAHLAACGECRARMDALRRRGAGLSRLLARTDFAVPAASFDAVRAREGETAPLAPTPDVIPLRRRPAPETARPWLRVAAVVLVALGVGIAASPARAWIVEWVSARLGGASAVETTTGGTPAVVRPVPVAPVVAASSVRFTPAGDELTVTVAHAQAGGALALRPVEGAEAVAEVVAGTGEADLLVLPAGLRIGNEPGAAADYRVGVPASVRRIRVRVGSGAEWTVARGEMGGELRIELGAER